MSATPARRRQHRRPMTLQDACVAALAVLASGLALAADPPHWSSSSLTIDCTSQCHTTHNILSLTSAAANVNLCQSCHNPAGLAADLPINSADSAVPGVKGTSHAFDVAAVHAGLDTQLPLDAEMSLRILEGKIVCSTCHDQHDSNGDFGGRVRISPPALVAGSLDAGDGTLDSGGSFSGAAGTWYLVRISQAGDQGSALFQWQKYTEAGGWTAWSADVSAGTDVLLADGIRVSFGIGSYQLDDAWEFSAAWPFLRAQLDAPTGEGSVMCRDCHRAWEMDHGAVEVWDGSYKSHPVGVGLNANAQGYDLNPPLDANGAAQGGVGADGNATNDLVLDGNGDVQCLTCHAVHGADSNSLTVDGP